MNKSNTLKDVAHDTYHEQYQRDCKNLTEKARQHVLLKGNAFLLMLPNSSQYKALEDYIKKIETTN